MKTYNIIGQALYYARRTNNESAKLCLHDSIKLFLEGDEEYARKRAIASLEYSVGRFHEAYIDAKGDT